MGHRSIANTVIYTAVADKRLQHIWDRQTFRPCGEFGHRPAVRMAQGADKYAPDTAASRPVDGTREKCGWDPGPSRGYRGGPGRVGFRSAANPIRLLMFADLIIISIGGANNCFSV